MGVCAQYPNPYGGLKSNYWKTRSYIVRDQILLVYQWDTKMGKKIQ